MNEMKSVYTKHSTCLKITYMYTLYTYTAYTYKLLKNKNYIYRYT